MVSSEKAGGLAVSVATSWIGLAAAVPPTEVKLANMPAGTIRPSAATTIASLLRGLRVSAMISETSAASPTIPSRNGPAVNVRVRRPTVQSHSPTLVPSAAMMKYSGRNASNPPTSLVCHAMFVMRACLARAGRMAMRARKSRGRRRFLRKNANPFRWLFRILALHPLKCGSAATKGDAGYVSAALRNACERGVVC